MRQALLLVVAAVLLLAYCSKTDETPPPSSSAQTQSLEDFAAQAERARIEQQGAPAPDVGALVQPAPKGLPKLVAKAAIDEAEHDCGQVVVARRLPQDGSVIAECSNGERYRVFGMKGKGTFAMKCSAAADLGIEGAC